MHRSRQLAARPIQIELQFAGHFFVKANREFRQPIIYYGYMIKFQRPRLSTRKLPPCFSLKEVESTAKLSLPGAIHFRIITSFILEENPENWALVSLLMMRRQQYI